MELDKLWTGNIGDVAHGFCIDGFLPDTELGRVIRLRQQVTGEFFLLTVLKKQTDRFWREEADFLLEQMRFASEHFRHGNLQQVPLCGTFCDQRFFIMQECPYTLTQYIKASGGKLIAPIALHIVFQILDALEFLHHIPAQEAGTERTCVTHDYLIPEHILLTDDGFAPTVKLSAQHKLYLGREDDDPLYGDDVQSFYLPVEAWFHIEKTGRIKTNLWTVTALLHSMLTGLPDFDDCRLMARKYNGESTFLAVNRRNLSVPQSLAKLIDTVLAQRDFPYDLTASEYKSMLKESAKKPYIRPARVDDDDDFLLDETDFEDADKVFCADMLAVSAATTVSDADLPLQTDAQEVPPSALNEEYTKEVIEKFTSQWELASGALRENTWEVRLAAVEALMDQTALAEVALKDKSGNVRKRAVEKLNDQKVLAKIALEDDDLLVSCAAAERLNNQSSLKRIALKKALFSSTREAAIGRLTDQAVLVKIALENDDSLVKYAAVERLTDQNALKRVALKASFSSTRELAVRRLTDQETLAKIALTDEDNSVRCTAAELLNNQDVLIRLALEDDYSYMRKVAVNRLADQIVLAQVALTDRHLDVREAAVKRLHDQHALVKVLLSRFWGSGKLSLAIKVYFGALSNLTDQESLYRVVSECSIPAIREAAAKKLTDEGLLLSVINENQFQKNAVLRRIAVERLTDQAKLIKIARSCSSELVRRGVVNQLEDPHTLETLALGDTSWKLRRAAVKRINSQAVLLRIARTDAHELVRLEALLCFGDKNLLLDFIQTAGTDARKKALNRMDAKEAIFLRFALNDPHEGVRRAATQRLHEDRSIEDVLKNGTGAAQLIAAKKTMNMTLLAEIALSSGGTMLQRVALKRSDCWTLPQLRKMVKKTKDINLGLARKRLFDMGGKFYEA